MKQTLKTQYIEEIRPQLKESLGISSIEAVPKLLKITVNTSSKDFKNDKDLLEKSKVWMAEITTQKPLVTKAKKSIAAFNLREGDVVGLKVTLRGDRMYDFYELLTSVVLPRLKDFQGVSLKTFDRQGNYTLGLSEQIVFPWVEYDKIGKIQGLEITFSTTAKEPDHARSLLSALGMPFQK
jgi:large subunit ribosomal protein L5